MKRHIKEKAQSVFGAESATYGLVVQKIKGYSPQQVDQLKELLELTGAALEAALAAEFCPPQQGPPTHLFGFQGDNARAHSVFLGFRATTLGHTRSSNALG